MYIALLLHLHEKLEFIIGAVEVVVELLSFFFNIGFSEISNLALFVLKISFNFVFSSPVICSPLYVIYYLFISYILYFPHIINFN